MHQYFGGLFLYLGLALVHTAVVYNELLLATWTLDVCGLCTLLVVDRAMYWRVA